MDDNLELSFCDLCNASVPQNDLDSGAARRVGAKIVGACCLSDLRGGPGKSPGGGRATLTTATVVLLIAVAGATVFLDMRISSEVGDVGQRMDKMKAKVELQDERFADLERRLETAATHGDVDGVSRGMETISSLVGQSTASLQGSIDKATNQVRELRSDLDSLRQAERGQEDELGRLTREVRNIGADLAALKAMPRAPIAEPRVDPEGPSEPAAAAAKPEAGVDKELAHFIRQLEDADPSTRFDAVDKLIQSGSAVARAPLIKMLGDSDPFVRRLTAEGLGSFKHASSIEALLTALGDPEGIVAHAAYAALKKLTGQDFAFDPEGDRSARAKGLRRWKEWWRANKDKF